MKWRYWHDWLQRMEVLGGPTDIPSGPIFQTAQPYPGIAKGHSRGLLCTRRTNANYSHSQSDEALQAAAQESFFRRRLR